MLLQFSSSIKMYKSFTEITLSKFSTCELFDISDENVPVFFFIQRTEAKQIDQLKLLLMMIHPATQGNMRFVL